MFFRFPALDLLPTAVYLTAALLPAAILLRYVYKTDAVEKEPPALLASLVFMGCLAALASGVLEGLGEYLLQIFVSPKSPIYVILLAFFVVAAVEEGTKLFFLKLRSWNSPDFNFRFDGVVYAVFVSLGFAGLENVQYVLNYGLSVALPRALLAIPGHMSFSIFMGVHYGRARLLTNRGDAAGGRRELFRAWRSAMVLHGIYDSCAMTGSGIASVIFLVFVLAMFFSAYRTLRRESATDAPIVPWGPM